MSQYFLPSVVNEIHKYYKYFILKMKKKRTLFSSNDIIKNRHHPMPCCRRRQRRRRHHWKTCLNTSIEYGWKSNGEKSLTNESSARVFVNDNTEQTENDLWASFKKQLKIVSFCAIWWRCILLARNFNNVTLSFALWRFGIFLLLNCICYVFILYVKSVSWKVNMGRRFSFMNSYSAVLRLTCTECIGTNSFSMRKKTPRILSYEQMKERIEEKKRNAKALNCATKDYLLNEFLMVPFIFCKKKKRMYALFRFIFLIRSSIANFSFNARNASTAMHIARHTSMRKSASNTRWKWENVKRFIIKKI